MWALPSSADSCVAFNFLMLSFCFADFSVNVALTNNPLRIDAFDDDDDAATNHQTAGAIIYRFYTTSFVFVVISSANSPLHPRPSFYLKSIFDLQFRPIIDARGSLFFVDHSSQLATNSVPCSEHARDARVTARQCASDILGCCSSCCSAGSKHTKLAVLCIVMPKP